MTKLVSLIIGFALIAGLAGTGLAQTPAATPAKDDKKAEKPADARKPAEAKKPVAHNANGTVKTAAADSLIVSGKAKDGKDAEWTFAVDPKTKIRKGGKDVTSGDLAPGDAVHVRYHAEGGKNVADAVMVRAPKKAAEAPKTPAPKKDETKK